MALMGRMMSEPLLISSLLRHAERHSGETEIVSKRVEGDLHRSNWREVARRARQTAQAFARLGLQPGDRVGTLAWNGHRHVEIALATYGSGAIVRALDPHLHPDRIVAIMDDARVRTLFFDLSFMPLIEAVSPRLAAAGGSGQRPPACATRRSRRV